MLSCYGNKIWRRIILKQNAWTKESLLIGGLCFHRSSLNPYYTLRNQLGQKRVFSTKASIPSNELVSMMKSPLVTKDRMKEMVLQLVSSPSPLSSLVRTIYSNYK